MTEPVREPGRSKTTLRRGLRSGTQAAPGLEAITPDEEAFLLGGGSDGGAFEEPSKQPTREKRDATSEG